MRLDCSIKESWKNKGVRQLPDCGCVTCCDRDVSNRDSSLTTASTISDHIHTLAGTVFQTILPTCAPANGLPLIQICRRGV